MAVMPLGRMRAAVWQGCTRSVFRPQSTSRSQKLSVKMRRIKMKTGMAGAARQFVRVNTIISSDSQQKKCFGGCQEL